jgi:23S rRNA (adenine2503-C2)-methyltransferase
MAPKVAAGDGRGRKNAIETVYIPDKTRGTLCVSSQVGCGLNCTFCSTATQGFNRNLTTAEIIGQVWVAARHLGNVPHQMRRLTNVVMMGMGEPLMNFDNVVRAMSVMRDDLGYGLANKRVTLSTSGLVPQIDRLSPRATCRWPFSACAERRAARDAGADQQEVPDRRADGLVRRYLRANKRRESVTFEYVMMKGINDKPEHARELARLMRQFDNACRPDSGKVNLIPFNPFPGTRYERSEEAHIRAFQKILLDSNVLTMVRRTRGDDIDAACGQLKGQVMDRTRRQAEFNKTLQAGKSDAAA